MPQQLVLTPLGLITEPNQLGQIPAGALSLADNIVMRSPGKIANDRGWATRYTLTGTDAGTTCAFVIATTGKYAIVLFNVTAGWKYVWVDMSTNTAAYGPTTLSVNQPGAPANPQSFKVTSQPGFCSVLYQGQIFANAQSVLLTWDTENPTSASEAAPREGGLRSVVVYNFSGTAGVGYTSSPVSWFAIVGVIRRVVQGREYVGPTSVAAVVYNTNASQSADPTINIGLPSTARAGDTVELYRTRQKPYGKTNTVVLSKLGEDVGAEYLLASAVQLTAADITAGTIAIPLSGTDDQLGRPCYVNQSIGGQGAQAFRPPALARLTAYKGHLIGFGATQPATIGIHTKAIWGDLTGLPADAAAAGIGAFTLGTVTYNGTATATAASAPAIANLRVGSLIAATGVFRRVTAIVGTSITMDAAASGGALTSTGFDQLFVSGAWGSTFGDVSNYFAVEGGITSHVDYFCPAVRLGQFSTAFPFAVPSDELTLQASRLDDARSSFSIGATRGANWVPALPETNGTLRVVSPQNQPNAVVWSEINQPESWPGVNLDHFSRGEVHAVVTTRDANILFYSDGLWRFSGTGGTAGAGYDWRADQLASGITISGSQAICVLNDVVYAYTSEGFISITSAGQITRISQGRIGDLLPGPPWDNGPYNNDTAVFLCADEENSEVVIKVPTSTALYRYNTLTDTFVTTQPSATQTTHAAYSRYTRSLLTVGKTAGGSWVLESNTGSPVSSAFRFQPVYTDNPFSLKHWQQLDVSFTGAPGVLAQYNESVNDAGLALSNAGPQAQARGSWDIPRDAPAIANSIVVALFTGPSAWTLQGISLQFQDLTEQRDKR